MATINTSPIIKLDEDAKRMFTLQILKQYYTKSIKSDFYRLVELLTQLKPVFLKTDNYTLLINPKDKCVLTNDIDKITDLFARIDEDVSFDSIFCYETLDPESFEAVYNKMCENDSKRHSLTSVLWRIYNEIIPIDICQTPHQLLLKIRKMPNFSEIPSAHECTSALLSSCMLEAKTLDELEANFQNVHPSKVHHIFLLSLLSGIVDVDLMADSFHNQMKTQSNLNSSNNKSKQGDDPNSKQQLDKKPMLEYEKIVADTLAKFDRSNIKKQQTENKSGGFFARKASQKATVKETDEVSRAKKTGFFARLLNKLVN